MSYANVAKYPSTKSVEAIVNAAIQKAVQPLQEQIYELQRENAVLKKENAAFKKYISSNSTNAQRFERLEKELRENYVSKAEFSKLQRKVTTMEFKLSVRQGLYRTDMNESFKDAHEKAKFKKLYKDLCEFAHDGGKNPSKTHEAYLRAERHLVRKNAGNAGSSLETRGATQMARDYKNLVNRLANGRAVMREEDKRTKGKTGRPNSNVTVQGASASRTPAVTRGRSDTRSATSPASNPSKKRKAPTPSYDR
jgi:hypothetical protein